MAIALLPSAVQKPGSFGVNWVSECHPAARPSLRSPDQSREGRGWRAGILLSKISQCLGRGSLLRAQMHVQLPSQDAGLLAQQSCLRVADPSSCRSAGSVLPLKFSSCLVSFRAQGRQLSKGVPGPAVSCGLSTGHPLPPFSLHESWVMGLDWQYWEPRAFCIMVKTVCHPVWEAVMGKPFLRRAAVCSYPGVCAREAVLAFEVSEGLARPLEFVEIN